ncbi:MAG TPA: MFS transporter [Syntrophorhabdaceae bacterium]|jgi:sugar phosphate permease
MEDRWEKAKKYRRLIFAVLAVQYMFVFFHRVCPAVVAPDLIKGFHISGAALGVLASSYFYPYAAMQIPTGIIADRWGTRNTIIFFGLVAALGSIGFGLSPSFSFAIYSRIVVGLGLSVVFVCSMKILAHWFRGQEFARVSGFFVGAGGIGWLGAATPLALLAQYFDWRVAFLIIGAVTALLALLAWFFVFDKPEDKGFPPIAKSRPVPASAKGKGGSQIGAVLRERRFWPVAIFNLFAGGTLFGFSGLWAGPYLTDVYHLSKAGAGNILSMSAFALILGSPALGYLSDKIFMSRKKVLLLAAFLHLACWSVLLAFPQGLPLAILYAIFFLMAVAAGAAHPIAVTATKEMFPLEMAGTSISFVNAFPFIGGVLYQPLVGAILDGVGKAGAAYPVEAYRHAFWLFFVSGLACLGAVMLAKENQSDIFEFFTEDFETDWERKTGEAWKEWDKPKTEK